MPNIPMSGSGGFGCACVDLWSARGPMIPTAAGFYAQQRLANDSIGNFSLSLTHIAPNSAYRIEVVSTGGLVSASSDIGSGTTVGPLSLPLYPAGNANNDLHVVVRKGTAAPKYKPFQTVVTAAPGAQSVYIAQEADPIA